MRRSALLSIVGVALAVTAAGCDGEDEIPVIARCEADLTQWTKTGTGALARLATTDDLFSGEVALGRAGDMLLANDRIRVIVETPIHPRLTPPPTRR